MENGEWAPILHFHSPFSILHFRPCRRSFPSMSPFGSNGRRVAIIAGVRTPFAKSGTALKDLTAIELGKLCVAELLQRTELEGSQVDAIVYGTVVPSVIAPNIAREVSLLPLLPKGVEAVT